MAIKKLQHGFTNPEQSKMLLELGVPADSADCYRKSTMIIKGVIHYGKVEVIDDLIPIWNEFDNIPCWSVGRMIELLVTCAIDEDHVRSIIADIANYSAPVETYVNVITYLCKIKELDFSKLEDKLIIK